ncbi:MAG: hypothetical protein K1X55_03280 [Chitinophagales bacterium]|nr:hypothetical protein [Chitinophagales bacterium]
MNDNRTDIDEAFVSLHEKIAAFCEEMIVIQDMPHAIQMRVERLEIDTPIEIDIIEDEYGTLQIGAVPPLYKVATSIEPIYHQIKFRIDVKQNHHGK